MSTNPKDSIGVEKPNLNLIPPAAMIAESLAMGLGAKKYGPYNWRTHKIQCSIYVAACLRHLLQWQDGQDLDTESGISHLAHARACLGILIDAESGGNMIDDRPPPGKAAELIASHTRYRGAFQSESS